MFVQIQRSHRYTVHIDLVFHQAIEELGAERIGHGYHVIDDMGHYELAKQKGVHFEVCPSSSICTNSTTIDKHAVKR